MYKYKCEVCGSGFNFSRKANGIGCSTCGGTLGLIEPTNKYPYLQIILDELDSVPKVIYKGEEIKLKQEVIFHWETDTDSPGGTTIEIEHAETGEEYPKSNRVVERIKNHIIF
mgnify:CR=1 FL=1